MAASDSRAKRIFVLCFAIGILVPAAYGFAEKLMLFILAVRRDLIGGITIVPIVNYFIVTAGMVCLLIWAIAHGMFRDVERPKYDMLERESSLDEAERAQRGGRP